MSELRPCPYCGSQATVIHMVDTYDRADFGWDCGCPRYSLFDKVHAEEQKAKPPKICGALSKEDFDKTAFTSREKSEAVLGKENT